MADASPVPAARPAPLGFKIALALIAALIAFAVCEVGARLAFPRPPDDSRQPQIVYQVDPEIRYTHVPNQRGWIDDGFVTINARGFRGRETEIPKPAGRFRVVLTGDSLTLGWGVNDNDTFAARLEQRLHERYPSRDLDVVNAGVSGYNTRQEVGWLARNWTLLQPDVVLVGFYSNDVSDAFEGQGGSGGAATSIAATAPKPGQILRLNPSHTAWSDRLMRSSRAVFVAGRAYKRFTSRGEWANTAFTMEMDALKGAHGEAIDRAWQEVDRQLAPLQALADAQHVPVALILLPSRELVGGQIAADGYVDRLRALTASHGFALVNPLPAMIAEKNVNGLFIPYDRIHPSAGGHRVIGDAVAAALGSDDRLGAGLAH